MRAMEGFLYYLVLMLLVVSTLALTRTFVQQHQLKGHQQRSSLFGKGFGTSADKEKRDPDAKVSQLKQQIVSITDNDAGICGSGDLYGSCCGRLHANVNTNDIDLYFEPAQITRARYAAYALGIGSYVISSSHQTNKVNTPLHLSVCLVCLVHDTLYHISHGSNCLDIV